MAKHGFNPCFPGSCSAIFKHIADEFGFNVFQSLFSWKLFCNRLIFPFIWQINALYTSVYRVIGENRPSVNTFIRIHQEKLFAKVPEPLAKIYSLYSCCSVSVSLSNTPPLHTITLRLGLEDLPLRGVCGHPLLRTNHQSPSRFPQELVWVEAASLSPCGRFLWKAKKEELNVQSAKS